MSALMPTELLASRSRAETGDSGDARLKLFVQQVLNSATVLSLDWDDTGVEGALPKRPLRRMMVAR